MLAIRFKTGAWQSRLQPCPTKEKHAISYMLKKENFWCILTHFIPPLCLILGPPVAIIYIQLRFAHGPPSCHMIFNLICLWLYFFGLLKKSYCCVCLLHVNAVPEVVEKPGDNSVARLRILYTQARDLSEDELMYV